MQIEKIDVDNVPHTQPRWQSKIMSYGGKIAALIGYGAFAFAIFDLLLFKLAPVLLGDVKFGMDMLARPAIFFFGGTVLVMIGTILAHGVDQKQRHDWADAANKLIDSHRDVARGRGFKVSHEMRSECFLDRVLIDKENEQVIAYLGPDDVWTGESEMALTTTDLDNVVTSNSLVVLTAKFDEIEEISIKSKPGALAIQPDGNYKYTVGGLALGGISGMIVGALVDSLIEGLKGSKIFHFVFDLNFRVVDGMEFTFRGVNNSFGVTSENIEEFRAFANNAVSSQKKYLDTVSDCFRDKLSSKQ